MNTRKKIIRPFALGIINIFLSGNHFFALKSVLLKLSGFEVGDNLRLVGPLYAGTCIDVSFGDDVWIGRDVSFDGNGSVVIGDRVDVGPKCTFATGGHVIGDRSRRAGEGETHAVKVGDGTWLSISVTVCGNTRVGSGCVVGAGSVVLKELPDNTLCVGIPCVVKKALN